MGTHHLVVCITWCLLACIAFVKADDTNLYEVLGVARDATADEIKKKARRLVLKHHPDRSDHPDSPEKFAQISEAFEILKDEKKREIYDKYGMEGVKNEGQMGAGGMGGFGGGDPFDIFSEFFGGGGGGRQHGDDTQKGKPSIFKLRVSLEQLYFGDLIDFTYKRKVLCPMHDDCFMARRDCKGPGIKLSMRQVGPGFVVQNQSADPECIGSGKGWKKNCRACPNGPSSLQATSFTVSLDKGMKTGDKITFDGQGEHELGGEAGDVIFVIETARDQNYTRAGTDLSISLVIDLEEALVGFETEIIHIDRKKLKIKNDQVTHDGQTLVVKGKGMPRKRPSKEFGDLLVKCKVQYPKSLDEKAKKLIKQSFADVQYA